MRARCSRGRSFRSFGGLCRCPFGDTDAICFDETAAALEQRYGAGFVTPERKTWGGTGTAITVVGAVCSVGCLLALKEALATARARALLDPGPAAIAHRFWVGVFVADLAFSLGNAVPASQRQSDPTACGQYGAPTLRSMAIAQGLLVFGAYAVACFGLFAAVATTIAWWRRTEPRALPWRHELIGHCCCIGIGVEMCILHMWTVYPLLREAGAEYARGTQAGFEKAHRLDARIDTAHSRFQQGAAVVLGVALVMWAPYRCFRGPCSPRAGGTPAHEPLSIQPQQRAHPAQELAHGMGRWLEPYLIVLAVFSPAVLAVAGGGSCVGTTDSVTLMRTDVACHQTGTLALALRPAADLWVYFCFYIAGHSDQQMQEELKRDPNVPFYKYWYCYAVLDNPLIQMVLGGCVLCSTAATLLVRWLANV